MIVSRKVKNEELAEVFRGSNVAIGSALTNSAGSPNVQDLDTDAFADVSVGDRFYISGESTSTVFLVLTKTDNNNLILNANVVNVHADPNFANWRAASPDYIDYNDLLFPPQFDHGNALWVLVYDIQDFGV
jgi:hypothetical protein